METVSTSAHSLLKLDELILWIAETRNGSGEKVVQISHAKVITYILISRYSDGQINIHSMRSRSYRL